MPSESGSDVWTDNLTKRTPRRPREFEPVENVEESYEKRNEADLVKRMTEIPLQYSQEEWDISIALSQATLTISEENHQGIAVRYPPEIVRDRSLRQTRPSPLLGETHDKDSSVSDQSDSLSIRLTGRVSDPKEIPKGRRPRTGSQTESAPNFRRPSFEKVDNGSPKKLFVQEINEDAPPLVVDEGATSLEILPLILEKHGLEGAASEYCLVAVDSIDGSERIIGDDESPLTLLTQHPDLGFEVRKLRRRKSIEIENERLFKQIMEEEGQMSSLGYFSKVEPADVHKSPSVDEFGLNIQRSTSAKEGNSYHIQWDLVGAPLRSLLATTLLNLDKQTSFWQDHLDSIPVHANAATLRGLLQNFIDDLQSLYQNSATSFQELMDVVEKDVPLILPVKGYQVELCLFSVHPFQGDPHSGELISVSSKEVKAALDMEPIVIDALEPILHHQNNHPVYREYFYDPESGKPLPGQLHFMGSDAKFGPLCVSVIKERTEESSFGRYRVLIWTKDGCHVRFLPSHSSGYLRGEVIVELLCRKFSHIKDQFLSWIPDESVGKSLLKFESDQIETTYKFGLLYVKHGQTREDEMFGNVDGSPEFEEFLNIMGEKVRLQGWPHFKAGLDTQGDSTGTHSLYCKWRGLEVMYHVSTLLPHDPTNEQQLARKRHIGNDICVILFIDGPTPYLPDTVASRFNHVFAVVRANEDGTYSFGVAHKDNIPPFGPDITRKKYPRDISFRDLVLAKMINGQNSAYRAPVFREKLRRTREFLLNDLIERYKPSQGSYMGSASRPATLSAARSRTSIFGEKEKRDKTLMFTIRSFAARVPKLSSASAGTSSNGSTSGTSSFATSSASLASSASSQQPPEEIKDFKKSLNPFSSRRTTLDNAMLSRIKKNSKTESMPNMLMSDPATSSSSHDTEDTTFSVPKLLATKSRLNVVSNDA